MTNSQTATVTGPSPGRIAHAAALIACALALGGCSLFHSKSAGDKPVRCSDAALLGEPVNHPPLKVPDGMDAPNTAGSVVIPPLNEPDHPRAPTDPCLSSPPDYGTPDTGRR
jgi:hypothetical protein